MNAFRTLGVPLRSTRVRLAHAGGLFVKDVVRGLMELSRNGLALLGLVVLTLVCFGLVRPDLRHQVELQAYEWLQDRREARLEHQAAEGDMLVLVAEAQASARATAADPRELTRQQALVAKWLSRRYSVAPEPLARLVQEAWELGQHARLEPTLILAVMAIESRFNPFAQSAVGAQGLMQVLTRVHDDKYQRFGGQHAAFDPVTNLRVGVQVLKDCIRRAGSVEGGLRYYVGAANLDDDGGYAHKVLAEQTFLRQIAAGRHVAANVALPAPPVAVTPSSSVPGPVASAATIAPVAMVVR